jgi:hypothetical protein
MITLAVRLWTLAREWLDRRASKHVPSRTDINARLVALEPEIRTRLA